MVYVRRVLLFVSVLAVLGLASPLQAIPACSQCGCLCGTPCMDSGRVRYCLAGCVDPACGGSLAASGEALSKEAFLASLSEPDTPCEAPAEPSAAR